MQAGLIASASKASGRHLRFVTLASMLIVINVWLWLRLLVSASNSLRLEATVAGMAAGAALAALLSVWRNPLPRRLDAMVTPMLRHTLATHRAGHIVAIYANDPSRITATRLADPCPHSYASARPVSQSSHHIELTIMLAGLSAEEVFAGESGNHAADDLLRATELGAAMAGKFGMTGSLVSLAAPGSKKRAFTESVLADPRTRKELEALLRDAKRDAMRIMLENRHLVVALRDGFLRHDGLSAKQIQDIVARSEDRRYRDDEVLVDLRAVGDRPRSLVTAPEL